MTSVILLAVACSNPKSVEQFAPAGDAAEYSFTLDLRDTSVAYALSFYGRIDAGRDVLDTLTALPMTVCFTAPDSTRYGETVSIPIHRDDPLSASFSVPYRRGMKPVLPGQWQLTLTADHAPEGLHGVGIILSHD